MQGNIRVGAANAEGYTKSRPAIGSGELEVRMVIRSFIYPSLHAKAEIRTWIRLSSRSGGERASGTMFGIAGKLAARKVTDINEAM